MSSCYDRLHKSEFKCNIFNANFSVRITKYQEIMLRTLKNYFKHTNDSWDLGPHMLIDYFLLKLNFQFCFRYKGEVTGSCAWSETVIININFTPIKQIKIRSSNTKNYSFLNSLCSFLNSALLLKPPELKYSQFHKTQTHFITLILSIGYALWLSEQSNTRNILPNLDLAYLIGKFKWEHSCELYLIKNGLAASFFHAKPEEFGDNTHTFQNKD